MLLRKKVLPPWLKPWYLLVNKRHLICFKLGPPYPEILATPLDEHVISCDVATCFIRVHSACRICEARIHSIQNEGVRGWTLSMQRLNAWMSFL
jgi:hypothetical protein